MRREMSGNEIKNVGSISVEEEKSRKGKSTEVKLAAVLSGIFGGMWQQV